MSPSTSSTTDTDRFDVRSPDGTTIAVWADGDGPPLVLVHGGLNDHTTDERFIDQLRPSFTTFAVDRGSPRSPSCRERSGRRSAGCTSRASSPR
jgi:pimeloyl-ACP methyl ester carboxylesterase